MMSSSWVTSRRGQNIGPRTTSRSASSEIRHGRVSRVPRSPGHTSFPWQGCVGKPTHTSPPCLHTALCIQLHLIYPCSSHRLIGRHTVSHGTGTTSQARTLHHSSHFKTGTASWILLNAAPCLGWSAPVVAVACSLRVQHSGPPWAPDFLWNRTICTWCRQHSRRLLIKHLKAAATAM